MTIHDWVEVAYFGLVTWLLTQHKTTSNDHAEAIKSLQKKQESLRIQIVYLANRLDTLGQRNTGEPE